MATTAAPTMTNGSAAPKDVDEQPFGQPGTGTLDERLARITGMAHVVADKKMKAGGQGGREYKYASIDAMSAAIGPLLAAEGVSITPVRVTSTGDVLIREKVRDNGSSYESIRHLTDMVVTWRIGGAGESFTAESEGKSADQEGSEKDVNQAHTFARINLYKSMFHLVTGDDPEQKPASSGSGSASSAHAHSGELPDIDPGAGVSGDLVVGPLGAIGIFFKSEDRAAFDVIKETIKSIPGRQWNGDAKRWIVTREHAGLAVAIARHIGLTIPAELDEEFPPTEQSPGERGLDESDLPPTTSTSQHDQQVADDIPFA